VTVQFLQGDCRDVLKTLPDESVHCVVTSPPYWGLRDYGVSGQLGLESTPAEYVEKMASVFEDVRRVLREDGIVWLNLGDSYAPVNYGAKAKLRRESPNSGQTMQGKANHWAADIGGAQSQSMCKGAASMGIKQKDLCGIPWRVAFALQAEGWYLRQDIIWAKPNPMPESVTDRCTKAHEYIFLLAKSERYYFDAKAIKEPAAWDRWGDQKNTKALVGAANIAPNKTKAELQALGGGVKNKRSVWTVTTKPFKGAHFATFPPDLIEPCVLAGCPEGGTVLDPFGGAGTVGLVAQRHNRNAILCELNPEYIVMAEARLDADTAKRAKDLF
jgi:DNA modification methylase